MARVASGPQNPWVRDAWGSLSISSTRRPVAASVPARWWQALVLPTPPFWFSMRDDGHGLPPWGMGLLHGGAPTPVSARGAGCSTAERRFSAAILGGPLAMPDPPRFYSTASLKPRVGPDELPCAIGVTAGPDPSAGRRGLRFRVDQRRPGPARGGVAAGRAGRGDRGAIRACGAANASNWRRMREGHGRARDLLARGHPAPAEDGLPPRWPDSSRGD